VFSPVSVNNTQKLLIKVIFVKFHGMVGTNNLESLTQGQDH